MINIEPIRDIFFDLDHTLWDFEKNSEMTFNFIFKKMNCNLILKDFLTEYEPINHFYWKLFRENKITQDELRYERLAETFKKLKFEIKPAVIDEISNLYINNLSSFSNLFFGTHKLLKKLKKIYSLHIITNGFKQVQHHKISNSGLTPYFSQIIIAGEVGYKKPNPKIFEIAMHNANTNPRNSLMIGDSVEADIEGALNLGMQALHFNSHNEAEHKKCPIVYSLDEIYKLFN